MRWLVTGAGGMLGHDMVAALRDRGHDVTAARRSDLDITDASQCDAAAQGHDVVVNCAAFTAVDAAEAAEAEAFGVNAVGAATVARAARRAGAQIIHLSTDYVFGGRADLGRTVPWPADAALAPLSAYGRTKAAGEWAVRAEHPDAVIVRTAWLYGAHGGNFATTIARLAGERDTLSVIDDQHGQPTWTVDVARIVIELVERGAAPGAYHATASGQASWCDFARAVVRAAGTDPAMVHPISTEEYPLPAPRPAYSVLSHDTVQAAGVEPIGEWDVRWLEAAPQVLAQVAAR